jgi:tetratricopeptide (TPR) repeat protein
MKSFAVSLFLTALLLLSACSQSPQRLVDAGNRYHDKKKFQEASILYRKAIAKDKTYADAYYREGLNLLDQKNAIEASKFFRRAVDLDPRNTDAEVKLSEIYLTAYAVDKKKFQNLLPEVKDLTSKILQQHPNDFRGIRLQAFIALADKNLPKAIEYLQQANTMRPHSREVVGWLAEALTASNQPDQAEKLAKDMIAHDKTWGPAYDFLFLQYVHSKRMADAEQLLKQRVDYDRTNATAVTNYANYLVQTQRYPQGETVMRKVLDDPRAFPYGHELMGDFYMRSNKIGQAIDQYRAGLKSDPKNELAYQQRVVGALTREGVSDPAKQAEALSLAKKLVDDHPKDLTTNELYASLLLDTGARQNTQESINELKLLVQNNNTDPILHFDLARGYYMQNNRDKALAEASEAIRLRPSLLSARIVEARVYEDRGQHGKALEQTEFVLSKNPGNPESRLVRARALVGLNELDKAQVELESLVQQFPSYGEATLQLADLYLAQKSYDKARQQFQTLWEPSGPNAKPDLRGFIGLQRIKLHQGQSQEAIASLQDLVQKNAGNAELRYILANFQAETGIQMPSSNPQRNGLLSQAESNYKQVLPKATNPSEVWLKIGVIQQTLNDRDAALNSFERASKANPRDANALVNRAELLALMGQKDKARDVYNQALGVDPDNVLALNNLAYISADAGQNLDEAMSLAERAKKRMPKSASVSDTLGYVYYRKNLTEQAIQELQSAVDSDPKNAAFRLHLAMALLKHGDKSGAKREAQAALRSADSGEQQKIRSFMSQIS